MKIVVSAVSAKMGGAATYLRHLAREIGGLLPGDEYILFVPRDAVSECSGLAGGRAVVLTSRWANRSVLHHLLWEQVWLRCFLLFHRIDLLINTSAYGLVLPPCPQTIILRNPIVFSRRYPIHLRRTGYAHRVPEVVLRREMMRISGLCSARVFVPTDAMGQSVLQWIPQLRSRLCTNRYGVELPSADAEVGRRLWVRELEARAPKDAVLILYVSHYARHKNFDTLMSAIPMIQERINRPVRVVITARIGEGVEWCGWDTSVTARKMIAHGVEDNVIQLGTVPHRELSELYRRCHLFAFPSYLESFGQPLAEAMASGLPVVASDEPISRELCGDAALYFRTFDASDLARCAAKVLTDDGLATSMRARGIEHAKQFSWHCHFHDLLEGAKAVVSRRRRRSSIKKPCGVSVLLITKNEELNIRKCLRSLAWADGVFVVDSFSTDRTVEICREFAGENVMVVQHPFVDYSSQRNWGLDHLPFPGEWVFALDADEVVPAPLAAEIVREVENDSGRYVGYLGKDLHIFLGGSIRQATRTMVRLFRRNRGRYVRSVNEKLAIEGNLGMLSGRVTHETRKGLTDWVAKNNRYTTMEATEYIRTCEEKAGRIFSAQTLLRPDLRRIVLKRLFVRMPFRTPLRFLYIYFWRGGVLDGVRGLIYSLLMTWVEFQISAKIAEIDLRRTEESRAALKP